METKTHTYNGVKAILICLVLYSGILQGQKSKMNVSTAGSVAPAEKGDGPQVFVEGANQMVGQGGRKSPPLLSEDEIKLCLFEAKALTLSYAQLMGMRPFFAQYRSEAFFKACIPALFRDRVMPDKRECYPGSKLLFGTEPLKPGTKPNTLLTKLLGAEGYAELNFCLAYLGMWYTDAELWQLYFEKNKQLVGELLRLDNVGLRLKCYILALDMEQKLCLATQGGFNESM